MTYLQLFEEIKKKKSYLCIGLDTDINKIPKHLLETEDPVYEFNKQIIDSTHDLCVSYKLNIAFYESNGIKGWQSLIKTLKYIPKNIFTIADAKRGDIGNTSEMYARAFFDSSYSDLDFDSITVNPYMGEDSVKPFLNFNNKWVILLALTSNTGSKDFQMLKEEDEFLYEKVLRKSSNWANENNMMYVIGATHADTFLSIRKIVPNHFLLVPGVGAQGGDLKSVSKNGMNNSCGLLINSSRQIIYASADNNFSIAARDEAKKLQVEMCDCLIEKKLI
jgi:orotidine-5'-phosphate decarboxylase